MYTSCMEKDLYLTASAILSLGKHCFLPLFANVIKNNITSSIIYNFMPVEDRMVNK